MGHILTKSMRATSILLIASMASVSMADDDVGWPFVRGPKFDNHAADVGLADAWPEKGPPVLWTRPLGTGYSSFTALNGRVFTQYQTLGGQFVVCLDANTGQTVWEHRYDWPYDPTGLYPGPRSTPTLSNGRVYFSGTSGIVGCLTENDGRLVWSMNLTERFGVEPVEFGYSCSPVVVQGKVLLPAGTPGASMVALDAETGATVWKSGNLPVSHVPAFPIQFEGRSFVIGYLRNSVAAFDLETGREVWTQSLSDGYDEHAAWPIYSEPHLWLSGPFRTGSQLLNLQLGESRTPPIVWKNQAMSNDVCSSVLVDGALYGFDLRDVQAKVHRPSRGQFRCLTFATGEERWTNGSPDERHHLDDEPDNSALDRSIGHASVLYADGKLILFNDTGEVILARANPDRFEPLGRARVLSGEICWTQPMLYRRHLYLRNHSYVVCLYLGRADQLTADSPRPTLTVADIPQTAYRDWVSIVLPIEPEFAMDAPSFDWLERWFWISTGCGLASALIAAFVWGCWWRLKRRRPASQVFWWPNWFLTFVTGALGTTLLSEWTQEFQFTWPLCLFVVIQATVYHTRMSKSEPAPNIWVGRFVVVGFLAVCVGYFLICRRLSLAFNWVFLSGFPAAIPFLVFARSLGRRPRIGAIAEAVLNLAAYSAFYWSSVGFMLWKYPPQ